MAKKDVLLELVRQFDKLRTQHTALSKEKDEVSIHIKSLIGDREDVPVEGYRVSYRYDSDKEVTKFDQSRFEKEEPKLYKKYVKVETVSGSRRLIIQEVINET